MSHRLTIAAHAPKSHLPDKLTRGAPVPMMTGRGRGGGAVVPASAAHRSSSSPPRR
jgi:hypothetical protein